MKPQADTSDGLVAAVALLEALTKASGLTPWIAGLEVGLQGADGAKVGAAIERDGIGRETLDAALLIKRVSGRLRARHELPDPDLQDDAHRSQRARGGERAVGTEGGPHRPQARPAPLA